MAHRHLIGLNSPPEDHVPDNLTLGPVLPAGWDGDAWKREGGAGNSYFLRAWNKGTGRFSVAMADKYETARDILVNDVKNGGSGKVEIRITEGKR